MPLPSCHNPAIAMKGAPVRVKRCLVFGYFFPVSLGRLLDSPTKMIAGADYLRGRFVEREILRSERIRGLKNAGRVGVCDLEWNSPRI